MLSPANPIGVFFFFPFLKLSQTLRGLISRDACGAAHPTGFLPEGFAEVTFLPNLSHRHTPQVLDGRFGSFP